MSNHALTTPREADLLVARVFSHSRSCEVLVQEERAFLGAEWLSLGSLALDNGIGGAEQVLGAVKRGAFEWQLPELGETRARLCKLIGINDEDKWAPKIRRALDAVAAISVRIGLQHPKFDPYALESMPFRRSTTIVADTSGALQGGLDFVARYLHPAARVKVPAIVQMEIVNFAERFLSGRRASKTKPLDLLIDHLMSQGGQRVLLRLELHADTEIERGFLLGDPLRSAFQSDRDPDLTELNLSVSIRAYVDRLILEAARHHLAQANLGHRVQLLTSDQGLARMALAEGIVPLFFTHVVAEDLFGKRLTGTILDPFSGRLRATPIASVLWELATAFGSARLTNQASDHSLTVSAIGEGFSWSPYQSHADLLWCDKRAVPEWPAPPTSVQTTSTESSSYVRKARAPKNSSTRIAPPRRGNRQPSQTPVSASGSAKTAAPQRLGVGQLLSLIDALDNREFLSEEEVANVLGTRNREGMMEYRRFLASGKLIEVKEGAWRIGHGLRELAIALRNEDVDKVRRILLLVPSFALFAQRISGARVGVVWDPTELGRAATTYRTLGEITRLCAPIFGEGLYPTPRVPEPEEFAQMAILRFRSLDQGDGLVATGAWLEELVRRDGVHPEISRIRLADASARRLLKRSTEGSTTEVRFDSHTIQVLRVQSGRPVVTIVHLYRGDYLIAGKSSTSLRIEGPPS